MDLKLGLKGIGVIVGIVFGSLGVVTPFFLYIFMPRQEAQIVHLEEKHAREKLEIKIESDKKLEALKDDAVLKAVVANNKAIGEVYGKQSARSRVNPPILPAGATVDLEELLKHVKEEEP